MFTYSDFPAGAASNGKSLDLELVDGGEFKNAKGVAMDTVGLLIDSDGEKNFFPWRVIRRVRMR